jgi:hypothetical protein
MGGHGSAHDSEADESDVFHVSHFLASVAATRAAAFLRTDAGQKRGSQQSAICRREPVQ